MDKLNETLGTLQGEIELLQEYELPQPKSGWRTSELVMTVGAAAIAVLVLFGYVPAPDADMVNGWVVELGRIVGSLGLLGATVWKYIESRTRAKGG